MRKSTESLTASQFTYEVAAVEFFHVRFKGHLLRSHAVLKGMGIEHPAKHTVPMLRPAASLYCLHFAAMGYARLGGGMMLQQRRGMRPGEMLGLTKEDLLFSIDVGDIYGKPRLDVALGQRTGTKIKRAQSVSVYADADPDVLGFMLTLRNNTPDGALLFPYSIDTYRRLLAKVSMRLGLTDLHYTPHGPRAGYATEATLNKVPMAEIMGTGRWSQEKTLRTYVDVVSARSVISTMRMAGLAEAMEYAAAHWTSYLSPDVLAQAYRR